MTRVTGITVRITIRITGMVRLSRETWMTKVIGEMIL